MTRRTIYVNARFLTQRLTGVQRYALELVRAMDALFDTPGMHSGIRLELLVPPGGLAHAPALRNISLREVGRSHGQVWEQFELPAHCAGELLFNPCNAAPLFKSRRVVTLHDAAVFTHPDAYSWRFSIWYRLLFRQICSSRTRVITVSDFSRRELARECGLRFERSTVIHHGHEHMKATPADTAILDRLGLRGRRFALAVSSHNPTKNFEGLVKALLRLGKADFSVVIAGGTNSRIFADEAGGWPDFVKAAGYVSDAELRALYEATSCFIFPSLYEGFGIPPLEALACGAPVLAANIPPLREIYGDAVTYFDPRDPDAIANGLAAAMRSPVRDEAAVAACLQRLTWTSCASQTLDYLSKA